MSTSSQEHQRSHLRLLQILSPATPIGAYSYSQGLEWAVHNQWITDESTFETWVVEQINNTLAGQELPLLRRLYTAALRNDITSAEEWSQLAIAVRDTAEMRQEELDRAAAYFRVIKSIAAVDSAWPAEIFLRSPLVTLAWFAARHSIEMEALLLAYSHSWLENSLITGVKIVPLGQTSAQKLLFRHASTVIRALESSASVSDHNVGVSLPAISMASCNHETQYSRVYRS